MLISSVLHINTGSFLQYIWEKERKYIRHITEKGEALEWNIL